MLTEHEIQDLKWFFRWAEGEMGVKSSFGTQIEKLGLYKGAYDDARKRGKMVGRARYSADTDGESYSGPGWNDRAFDPETADTNDYEYQQGLGELYSEGWKPSREFTWTALVRVHPSPTYKNVDPYTDGVCKAAGRNSKVRRRLVWCQDTTVCTFWLLYGPDLEEVRRHNRRTDATPVCRNLETALGDWTLLAEHTKVAGDRQGLYSGWESPAFRAGVLVECERMVKDACSDYRLTR